VLSLGAVVALAGASGAPVQAAGLNGSGALNELTEGQTEETKTATTAAKTSTTSQSGVSGTVLVLALAAAVVVLSGVAFVIVRDARRVAPANDADIAEARSEHDSAVRLRKRRAKAKAARQQRKRNR
jgi:hypothetical protein